MKTILLTPAILLATYLFIGSFYQLILAVAARYYKPSSRRLNLQRKIKKLLVVVPAYAENQVILHSASKNLSVRKSSEVEVEFLVIADQLLPETCTSLRELGAEVLEVKFEKSTKVKALNAAINHLKGRYFDAVVILDADNVMEPDFLLHAKGFLEDGFSIIQGNRIAANVNSDFALLDGLSEAANTEMLCKGANVLGFSSKLSGSAMVFDYSLFEESIPTLKAIGGFDKELEIYFTSRGHFIHYSPRLAVWDEKVNSSQAYSKQRGRWIQSQYAFLNHSFLPALKALKKGNVDYFHKSLQLALPPRALAPFILALLILLGGVIKSSALLWIGCLGFFALISSYALSLSSQLSFQKIIIVVRALPNLFLSTLKALGWVKKAKKQFIHTNHQVVQP